MRCGSPLQSEPGRYCRAHPIQHAWLRHSERQSYDDEATRYFINAFRNLEPKDSVAVLFSVVLIIFSGLQYLVYSRQAQIMETQVRPWAGLSSVFIGPVALGQRLPLIVSIKNSGGSPAQEVKLCSGSNTLYLDKMDESHIENMMKLYLCTEKGGGGNVLLLPNTSMAMNVSREAGDITQEVVDDVQSDKLTFVVFGRVVYKSATDGAVHWNIFCAFYIRAAGSFTACPYGNAAGDGALGVWP